MTTPGPIIIPDKALTPSQVYTLQTATREGEAAKNNLDMQASLEEVRERLLNDLLGGFLNVPEAVMDAIRTLIETITGVIDGGFPDLDDWVNGLTENFSELEAFVQQLVDAILTALRGVPIVGGALADIISDIGGLKGDVDGASAKADTAKTVAIYTTFNVASNKPLWSCMDPTAEVSFPWSDLAYSTGGSISTNNISASVARLAKLRVGSDQTMNTISFLARSSGTVSGFYLDLYAFQPDDSSWSLVYSSPDMQPSLTTTLAKMQVVFSDDGFVVTAGEMYAVQFRMSGAGAVALATKTFPDLFIPGFEPEVIGASRNPTSVPAPATISNATMDGLNDGNCVYVEIGSNVGQVGLPRSWFDDFNSGSWNSWLRSRNAAGGVDLAIVGGQVEYGGTSDGTQFGMFVNQTASDYLEAQVDVSDNASIGCGVGICNSNTGYGGAYLRIRGSNIDIIRLNSATSATQYATVGLGTGDGTFKIRYDPDTNTFTGYQLNAGNWVALLSYVDSGNVFSHGAGNRFGGIWIARSFFTNGGIFDNFYLRDWQ